MTTLHRVTLYRAHNASLPHRLRVTHYTRPGRSFRGQQRHQAAVERWEPSAHGAWKMVRSGGEGGGSPSRADGMVPTYWSEWVRVGPNYHLEDVAPERIGSSGLKDGILKADPTEAPECCRWQEVRPDGTLETAWLGEAVFFPGVGRAGVVSNGDPVWTAASSATDAVRRYLANDLAP
jgi:hypothetical protein